MLERQLLSGNEALAEAAIRAGCRFFFGYPITPQTEVNAHMARRLPELGGVFLQAESEIAAVNMALGAAAAGGRVMTSSSSPGISLKTEGISYLAGSDLPCVIVNVQRSGPGLGGIQPAQGDYFQATKAPGHGDVHILVFAPASVQENIDMVYDAFDCSDRYRVPAMILSDGVLAQMMEPARFPEKEVSVQAKPWALTGHGHSRPRNVITSLHLDPFMLERSIRERFERYERIRHTEVRHDAYLLDDAEIILTAYGASARIARSAVDEARSAGIRAGLLRPLTLWPFPEKAFASYAAGLARCFLTVEMSMGQMLFDVRAAVGGKKPVHFFGRVGGIVPTPKEILAEIRLLAEAEGLCS